MAGQRTKANQTGFTIVELLIATTVLSVILLLTTIVLTGIGNLYYKGVNQARIQDDVRTITDELSQHLQLTNKTVLTGGAPVTQPSPLGNIQASVYCIGDSRYSYTIGNQIGTTIGHVQHVLWRDSMSDSSTGGCVPADLTKANPDSPKTDGVELIAPNSRLMDLTISNATPYSLSVAAAYGDNDLLCSPSIPATCTGAVQLTAANYVAKKDIICRGNVGDQFCATANLATVAVKRVN